MWLCFGAILCGGAITDVAAEISWELGNGTLQMKVERQGAMISDLRLVAGGTHWLSPMNEQAPAEPFGHFLCFDRWGPVTAAEAATGFSFHGEAARVPWAVLSPPTPRQLEIKTILPLAGLAAERRIHLPRVGDSRFALRCKTRRANHAPTMWWSISPWRIRGPMRLFGSLPMRGRASFMKKANPSEAQKWSGRG